MKLKLLNAITCLFLSVWFFSCTSEFIEVSSNPVKSPISATKFTLKVFLENSGSMDGYMCDGSHLKDAMYSYLSDLNQYADTTELNYINNKKIPFDKGLEQYVKTLNPKSFREAGGDRSNSDIGKMINDVVKEVSDTSICLFVSDCILDLRVEDAQNFLNTCKISIKNSIVEGRKRIPNLAVMVIKLTSDFNGKYFYPNKQVEMLKQVKRPYYIWVLGNSNIIADFNSKVSLFDLSEYGFENHISFVGKNEVPFEIKNKYGVSNTLTLSNGNYIATIKADFRATLQPDSVIQNLSNYSFENPLISIESIKQIETQNSIYTHEITFKIPKNSNIMGDDALVLQSPKISEWVYDSNDESGADIKNNLSKTTGLKYLIEGIADAYKKDKIITSCKFNIKHK